MGDLLVIINKLYMHGFKSFQKPTVVPLFKGFNAFIGPNGSGKSNIMDALTFVLGMRSSNLRAGRMDHLIYNGGFGRKPSDYAVVTIIFDNKDKAIPLDTDEVTVSRKVNRKGVSLYRLNDKRVPKHEVDKVFGSMSLRADGYNIIQQGDITRVVDMKPRERREIIDEISGIKEYNLKKEKAMQELEIAEKRVNEAQIILQQKDEYFKNLEKDKKLAEKSLELQKKENYLLANIAYSRVKGVEGQLENVTRALDLKGKEVAQSNKDVGTHDLSLEKKENRLKEVHDLILQKSVNAKSREEIEEIREKIVKRESKIEANGMRVQTLDDAISRFKNISQGTFDVRDRAVEAILDSTIKGVYGTVGNLMKVDGKFQIAIESAAGSRLKDIIVESEQNAIEGVEYLRDNSIGRARFLPLDRMRPFSHSAKAEIASKMPGLIDFASDLITYNKKYDNAFKQVFRDTLIAENMNAAKTIRGLRVVTMQGDVFEPSGSIYGGAVKKPVIKIESANLVDVQGYEREKKNLLAEIGSLEEEIGDLKKLLDEKLRSTSKESEEVKRLENEKKRLEEEIEKTKSLRKGVYEKNLTMGSEIEQLRIQRARLEAEYENYMLNYEKYKTREDLKKGNVDEMEKELIKVQRSLRNIGPINQKAIEDFGIFKKDYDEFKMRVDKLVEERGSILNMIEEIEQKRKNIFKTTLDAICDAFKKSYKDLVGGDCDLQLEIVEDIESGLVISAQPPGKKLHVIDSLSGGEKSMAAIAFLFGILMCRPTPFYILDEIDASLDASNSAIVGDLIKRYSNNSQFLIISHNDALVERAERVYGISMQQGTSQILGVELEKKLDEMQAANT